MMQIVVPFLTRNNLRKPGCSWCFFGHFCLLLFCFCLFLSLFVYCLLEKCFDNSLYEFFDVGMSWSRVQQGAVEQCTCVNGQIECETVRHKSKALFYITAIGLRGVGIKDSKDIKVGVCYT